MSIETTPGAPVEGFVAAGYECVKEAFERNFHERGEVGAAFAAVRDGVPVVDLWGGSADPAAGRRWHADTLQLIFSGTKGLVATCLLMLVDRGLLALDDPVCAHWPEFAARGKEHVTVADLAAHRARLPGVRAPISHAQLVDDVGLARLLARQPQENDPRAALAYHGLTYGWLCGELIRRVSGRSVGAFFAEQVAGPLGLELWIGLPQALEPRVSTIVYGPRWGATATSDDGCAADELLARVCANPPLFPPDRVVWNERAMHAAEIPGVNAIGTARSLARLYGCLARGGELDGVRLMGPEVVALGRQELSRFHNAFNDEPMAYGAGFRIETDVTPVAPADAFGHGGAGGSVHLAWPHERIGLSYAMNELRDDPAGDPRSEALLAALYEAVRSPTPGGADAG